MNSCTVETKAQSNNVSKRIFNSKMLILDTFTITDFFV